MELHPLEPRIAVRQDICYAERERAVQRRTDPRKHWAIIFWRGHGVEDQAPRALSEKVSWCGKALEAPPEVTDRRSTFKGLGLGRPRDHPEASHWIVYDGRCVLDDALVGRGRLAHLSAGARVPTA